MYSVDKEISVQEWLGETEIGLAHENHQAHLEEVVRRFYDEDSLRAQVRAAETTAWLSGRAPFVTKGQEVDYPEYKVDERTAQVSAHASAAARILNTHALYVQKQGLRGEANASWGAMNASTYQQNAIARRYQWEEKNEGFQRRRTLVSRAYQDLILKLATEPDGVLNYGKRLLPLRERFRQDFRDALARLRAIQAGMKDVYSYDVPLPADTTAVDYYDQCLLWTRDAIQFIVRFARREQNAVYPVSVRHLIEDDAQTKGEYPDAAWKKARGAGEWVFSVAELGRRKLAHVRLRGIGATLHSMLTGTKQDGRTTVWQLAADAPSSARVVYLDGSEREVKQVPIPEVLFGRVEAREVPRSPDLVGVSALFNLSPLGTWTVRLLGSIPQRNPEEIEDIVLDLHIAFRPLT